MRESLRYHANPTATKGSENKAKELGFNTFAIEATWPEANLINDYVHTGVGDPARLLAGLYFWTWNTQEVLDMINWMWSHSRKGLI
jgi:erythromycin esterase